jgi:hypothetical protein
VTLELALRGAYLVATIVNPADREQRLWDWHNSWGWYAPAVEVRDGTGISFDVKRTPRDWSKNGPTVFVLQPGERREMQLDLHDGWWKIERANATGTDGARLRNLPLELRARLRIDPTPESEQLHVFTGTLFSDWVTSTPPHDWLPAPSS